MFVEKKLRLLLRSNFVSTLLTEMTHYIFQSEKAFAALDSVALHPRIKVDLLIIRCCLLYKTTEFLEKVLFEVPEDRQEFTQSDVRHLQRDSDDEEIKKVLQCFLDGEKLEEIKVKKEEVDEGTTVETKKTKPRRKK